MSGTTIPQNVVLTVAQMGKADGLAIAQGLLGTQLMEAAGWAVARAVWTRFPPCRVAVLCGPGNNGGDGFVAARHLARRGYRVRLGLLGRPESLNGDAAHMARIWPGVIEPLTPALLDRADVVVDALFGAGLSRPVDGAAADMLAECGSLKIPVIAVDMPSGVSGDSGAVMGVAAAALATVTFFRLKPGHLLQPGRSLCGEIELADIGIPVSVLTAIGSDMVVNDPESWRHLVPVPVADSNKFNRGHLLVVAGAEFTGAARLVSLAARRAGAGLVTVLAPDAALPVFKSGDAGTMARSIAQVESMLADTRCSAVVIGPGSGAGPDTRARVMAAQAWGKAMVVDADALTALAAGGTVRFENAAQRIVMTPHEGEFARLWGEPSGDKIVRTRAAARQSGAVVLLKGADTVIAHPEGRVSISVNGPPWLATAGAGDVLAGVIGALMAQGLDAFDAATMGAWVHGEAARLMGPGLIAEDLAPTVGRILAGLSQ